MKIGILSDTHTKVEYAKLTIDMLLKNGAEFFIHAGDICEPETLELLENSPKRYVAVYGNNDAHLVQHHNKYNLFQEPYSFKLAQTQFKLMHLPFYMAPDAEVIISGHTHKFHSEFIEGTLFLNPGENCARNKPTSESLMLEVTEDKFLVTHYTREIDDTVFKTESFSYIREKND